MTTTAAEAFARYRDACPNRIPIALERRPGNALNVEIGQPMDRCRLRTPEHWRGASAARWLASGGSPLVLGICSRGACPLKPDHCESCGRMRSTHTTINGRTWPFDCQKSEP